MRASRPLRVRVPAIRVDAPLTDLRLDGSGRLGAPPETDDDLAGWWADGPAPGERGTAIIAGHVDIPTGPAVFYDLGAVKPGMSIDVARSDRATAHFTVDAIDVYAADDFPDDKVYADTGDPELRLITCGGGYDKQHGHYNGNVVVSAHLTAP
ncbi:class F sortase [Streptomyces sp. NPDC003717]|uniref:class F sortase n=1 Tax=Streptomyces sp. NPDC003717 TaxID=3154276 RepID=UPI0033BDE2E6